MTGKSTGLLLLGIANLSLNGEDTDFFVWTAKLIMLSGAKWELKRALLSIREPKTLHSFRSFKRSSIVQCKSNSLCNANHISWNLSLFALTAFQSAFPHTLAIPSGIQISCASALAFFRPHTLRLSAYRNKLSYMACLQTKPFPTTRTQYTQHNGNVRLYRAEIKS